MKIEDLFADIGTDPMIAINAAKQLAADSVNDPERYPSKKSARAKKARSNKAKGKRLEDNCIDDLTEDGWLAVKVEYTSSGYGATHTYDMMGIADILAIRSGVTKLVQVTTEEKRTDHERTFVEDRPDHLDKRTQRTPYQNLVLWMQQGGEMELWLGRKEKGRWLFRVVPITAEWLEARKEKLEQRRRAA